MVTCLEDVQAMSWPFVGEQGAGGRYSWPPSAAAAAPIAPPAASPSGTPTGDRCTGATPRIDVGVPRIITITPLDGCAESANSPEEQLPLQLQHHVVHLHHRQQHRQQSSSFPASLAGHAKRIASSISASSSSSSSSSYTHRRRSSRHSASISMMPDIRHIRGNSLSIANGNRNPPSALPRSPPNTSHVPCKFFRQGQCQAGNACPFSHDLGAAADTICKYFAKGNCKFGPKCANMHILPDGRRVNYGKNGFTIITGPSNLPGLPSGDPTSSPMNANNASALTSSLYGEDQAFHDGERRQIPGHNISHLGIDNGVSSDFPYSVPSSTYGSPRDGFGLSPVNGKGLSVLDAPLPASFDSTGISNAARFPAAPWPSSVPSKFGLLDSPSASLSNAKDSRGSEALKLLHTSAFGSSDHLTPTTSSPPSSHLGNIDEYFGKRAMHSSRYAKPKMLSSSMPKTNVDRDWEAGFAFGDDVGENVPENYLPENLQDLLTPAEKARRGSFRGENDVSLEGLSKYGSPMGSSPSRWGPLFQRQKEDEELTRSARSAGSAFGHVGSPLRNSMLAQEMNNGLRISNSPSRPGTMRVGSESMSVLSQQLQRSRLDDSVGSSSPLLHPSSARGPASGVTPIGRDRAMERHVSTGSISSSVTGRFTTPIDEEDPAFVFSMEEEDDPAAAARLRKRVSSGLAIGSLPSYAGAVSKKGQGDGSKESKSANGANDH